MTARDLMTPHPGVVTPHDPLSRAAEIMRDYDVGMVPVVSDTLSLRMVGVITDRDIAVRCVAPRHGGRCTVGAHLTDAALVTVAPGDAADEVMARMKEHQVRRVLVVDGDGRLLGVVSLADLARVEGPVHPLQVETVLQELSAPAHVLAGAGHRPQHAW